MLVLLFEGEIAAGKTTLVDAVAKQLRKQGLKVATAKEPVDDWKEKNILQSFYSDPHRYAYTFQTYTYVTRCRGFQRALADCPEADVLISERSPYTDRHIFMELQRSQVSPMEMELYEAWCPFWLQLLPPEIRPENCEWRAIYLKPSLTTSMARLQARARDGEIAAAGQPEAAKGVTLEYQRRLRKAHEAYLENRDRAAFPEMPPCPFAPDRVLVVGKTDADGDFRPNGEKESTLVGSIITWAGF